MNFAIWACPCSRNRERVVLGFWVQYNSCPQLVLKLSIFFFAEYTSLLYFFPVCPLPFGWVAESAHFGVVLLSNEFRIKWFWNETMHWRLSTSTKIDDCTFGDTSHTSKHTHMDFTCELYPFAGPFLCANLKTINTFINRDGNERLYTMFSLNMEWYLPWFSINLIWNSDEWWGLLKIIITLGVKPICKGHPCKYTFLPIPNQK